MLAYANHMAYYIIFKDEKNKFINKEFPIMIHQLVNYEITGFSITIVNIEKVVNKLFKGGLQHYKIDKIEDNT